MILNFEIEYFNFFFGSDFVSGLKILLVFDEIFLLDSFYGT